MYSYGRRQRSAGQDGCLTMRCSGGRGSCLKSLLPEKGLRRRNRLGDADADFASRLYRRHYGDLRRRIARRLVESEASAFSADRAALCDLRFRRRVDLYFNAAARSSDHIRLDRMRRGNFSAPHSGYHIQFETSVLIQPSARSIKRFEGRLESSTFSADSAPTTGSFSVSSRPSCASTEA